MAGSYKDDSMKHKLKHEDKRLAKRWPDHSIDLAGANIKEIRDFCRYKLYEYQRKSYFDNELWSDYFQAFKYFTPEHFQALGMHLLYKLRYELRSCGLFVAKHRICTIRPVYEALVDAIRSPYRVWTDKEIADALEDKEFSFRSISILDRIAPEPSLFEISIQRINSAPPLSENSALPEPPLSENSPLPEPPLSENPAPLPEPPLSENPAPLSDSGLSDSKDGSNKGGEKENKGRGRGFSQGGCGGNRNGGGRGGMGGGMGGGGEQACSLACFCPAIMMWELAYLNNKDRENSFPQIGIG